MTISYFFFFSLSLSVLKNCQQTKDKQSNNKVQIVNHNFCDYLGSVKRSPTNSSSGYASIQSSSCQNKVRVYVPYSTLIALTNEIRETPVDDLDEDDDVVDVVNNLNGDVVICDTQVILRINPDQQPLEEVQYSTCKKNNKRMTRKLLNESETFHKTSAPPNAVQLQACPANLNLPRRKDLCKLLGLNEQDVDLMIVPEVKVAQKVALSHSADLQTSKKETAKKKDLAKFLGVDEIDNNEGPSPHSRSQSANSAAAAAASAAGVETKSVTSSNSVKSKDTQQRPKSLLINWGQMVKSSVKGWKFDEGQNGDMEMDVPVQLRQIPAREPERTNRKDLSKFLGFDDSDSEEIVFIRNAPNNAQSAGTASEQASINDSSLTRKSSSFDDEDDDSDDSVGSLRSFDSFVRRSLRCGASSEFAIQITEDMAEVANAPPHFYPPKRGDVVCSKQRPNLASPMASAVASAANQRRRRKIDAEKRAQEVNGMKVNNNEMVTELNSAHKLNHHSAAGDPTAVPLTTLDRKPLSSHTRDKPRVMFGPNSRRMISPVRNKRSENKIPPVFRREEPLLVYPQKPPLFYQHYPVYGGFGILPPGGRINPNNGRIRVPRHPQRVPVREHPHPDY